MSSLAAQAPENPWCTWWWVTFMVGAFVCVLVGVLLFTNYALGWPRVELSHAARQARKDAAQIEAIQSYWSRQHMMDDLRRELELGAQVWEASIEEGGHWFGVPADNEWSRYQNSLDRISPEAAEAIRRAYEARSEIFRSSRQRSREADEIDDTRTFTEAEIADRETARELFSDAAAKIRAAEVPPP